jgi:multidrug resistance efflux pump
VDNQTVKAGDVLIEIDARDYDIAVARAGRSRLGGSQRARGTQRRARDVSDRDR